MRPGLGAEGAGEVAGAHVGASGHGVDGVIAGDVLEQRPLDLAQRLAIGPLSGERGAELGLVAGTAQEQHEVAGDGEGGVTVEVLLDEREREVHAGGDAGGGPDATVAHEDRLGVDEHVGMHALQLLRGRPVRGRATAVEQAGAGEQEGAGAHGGGASALDASAIQSSSARVARRLAWPAPPGDDQRVDRLAHLAESGVGGYAQAAGRAQRLAVAAEHAHLVAALTAAASSIRRWAPANTSSGPVTSRLCTPG